MQIKVRNSGVVTLVAHKDSRRGNLFVAEALRQIPFSVKRVYFITNIKNRNAVRGGHAHKKLSQVIFAANGAFMLSLDDGKRKQAVRLNNPGIGVILGPKLWHTMSKFSRDAVVLVFAGDYHKESDYIRDYSEFRKIVSR